MSREQFLTDQSVAALRRLLGRTIYTIYAPNLDAAGAHLAAWTLSMLLEKNSFMNFSCDWSESPHFLNDSWQITVVEERNPLKIMVDESDALVFPCTISMYKAKPIEKIEILAFTNAGDNEGAEETVNYDQALLFTCEGARIFCIGCLHHGPGIAEWMHFSEDPEVIDEIVAGSSVRLVLE